MLNKKQQLVVKDNSLINAAYRLDLTEQRLILMSIVKARENGAGITAEKPLMVFAEDYAEQFHVSRQAAYMALSSAVDSLFDRYFSYERLSLKNNIELVKSRWVSQVSYLENEGAVSIIFAPSVIPLITRLEKHFTSYEIEQVRELSSIYAIRLYELIIAWKSVCKTPVFELTDFRLKLGVEPHEYQKMVNFKSRVLDMALNQINIHTDIIAKYEQHKSGRKITGFSFTFKPKNAPKSVKKQGRQQISKDQAAQKALPGEDWSQLVKRLAKQYKIIDL